ncbi:MAG: FtsX-like permease family protein [Clostridia bacterium]|nr:FtsX-like permease family protein [Clostridia bacterium]
MKTYLKTVFRTIKLNIGRFVAMTAIVLLGICFVTGLGTLSYKIEVAMTDKMASNNVADVVLKSKSPFGFLQQDIDKIKNHDDVYQVQSLTVMDIDDDGRNTRIIIAPLDDMKVNTYEVVTGSLPTDENHVVVLGESSVLPAFAVGDKVTVMGEEKTISGIIFDPLYISKIAEPDMINEQDLELIVYIDSQYNNMPLPATDLYVKTTTKTDNLFDAKYIDKMETLADEFEVLLGSDKAVALTLDQNAGYAVCKSYNEKVDVITLIFPVFFIAVTALVVLTTMTRLVEEERPQIGCYTTLGVSKTKIAMKYIIFSTIACVAGSILGVASGIFVLPLAILPAFESLLYMPAIPMDVDLTMGIIAVASMFVAVLGVTIYLVAKETKDKPANILRPKAPKAGKKIFLEYIPFIWKKLSFKYKSTCRNIFRYVKHLLMTVISVAGSTALIFAGFGLHDISKTSGHTVDISMIGDSLAMISVVVILFAICLCVLVIFNLTIMNIGERKRELATLKVLGYHDLEVSGYIFREIFIMAVLGIIVGLPLGYGLVAFVFEYLEFGSINDVKWLSYLYTIILVVVVIGIVDILLHFQNKKIDMTTSLKTVE